jgi:16S rRNA (guanine527-N7)-methyltransferase
MSGTAAVDALCKKVGIEPPRGWHTYFELARSWGARTDLTAAREPDLLAEILFLDAAFLVKEGWCPKGAALVDVGAGVGAPTIPLLVSDETLQATLVEPRRIRTVFLRSAVGSLQLGKRARVLEQRVDPRRPALEGAPFEVALSRATFSPEDWLPIGASLAREVWALTAGVAPTTTDALTLVRRLDYRVPTSGAPRTIFAYR